jgi:HD-like signal output (HDOD) protein
MYQKAWKFPLHIVEAILAFEEAAETCLEK